MSRLIFSIIFIFFSYSSCKQQVKFTSPAGYNLSKPQVFVMPGKLDEISGIAFKNGNPDTLYAEQDEEGKVFYFVPGSTAVQHHRFAKKGDYEDIALFDSTVVILRSDGVLFSFTFNASGDNRLPGVQQISGGLPPGEYEAMYAEEAGGSLYVMCKHCPKDEGGKNVTGYQLQKNGAAFELKNTFAVNTTAIAEKTGQKQITFRPSAMSFNRRTNQWWILSSINKLLVTADDQWKVMEVFPLAPALFNQPEGIAFDLNNNLYISNEKGSTSNATLLKFNFEAAKK